MLRFLKQLSITVDSSRPTTTLDRVDTLYECTGKTEEAYE